MKAAVITRENIEWDFIGQMVALAMKNGETSRGRRVLLFTITDKHPRPR